MIQLAKLEEELRELKQAFEKTDTQAVQEELGDVLFTCANLSRHLGADPESLTKQANKKFERRFRYVEQQCQAAECTMEQASAEQMEQFWRQAKQTGL